MTKIALLEYSAWTESSGEKLYDKLTVDLDFQTREGDCVCVFVSGCQVEDSGAPLTMSVCLYVHQCSGSLYAPSCTLRDRERESERESEIARGETDRDR